MHSADGVGKHQSDRRYFEDVAVHVFQNCKRVRLAICEPRPFFLWLGAANLDALRQSSHAAVNKDHRADHHCGRNQHVEGNGLARQEPA